MTAFTLEDVAWGQPRVIQTRNGPRRIREWSIPAGDHPFWRLWRKGYLREQGYSIRKWKQQWQLTEWREADGTEPVDVPDKTAAAKQQTERFHNYEQVDAELDEELLERFREVALIYEQIKEETGKDYRYQLPHIKRIVAALVNYDDDGALDASDTGTGKTPVACAVARVLGCDVFVVCPLNQITPWERMARRFGVKLVAINYEQLRTGRSGFGKWRYHVNKRTKKREPVEFVYSNRLDRDQVLFVFDECHKLKDYKTQNCIMGVSALDQGFKVMALSATAVDNPMHMKFVALLTGLIRHPMEFLGFMTEHGVKKGRWGYQFVGGRDVLSLLHRKIFPAHGSRMRIADLGDRFARTQIISEAYNMGAQSAAIREAYRVMNEAIAKLEEARAKDRAKAAAKGYNVLIITERLRARQLVELLKVPTLEAMARDALAEGNAVIVILNYQDSINELSKRLRCVNTITGDDKPEARQRLIDRFNADDESLVIMNIKAGGLGIDLHGTREGKTRVSLISPTDSGQDIKQAFGRPRRAYGAPNIQKVIWAAGTVEEAVCTRFRERIQRIDIFNDDQLDDVLKI